MSKKKKILIIILTTIFVLSAVGGTLVYFLKIRPDILKRRELELMVKQYYQAKLTKYEQENLIYDNFEVDVAFLGDSLTDGYDVANYFPQFVVSNRGISGETTIGLEKRLKVSVYDLQPKIAVMLIGANNMNTMFSNYENILKGFQENLPNTKIVLLSLTSMSQEWGKKNQLAAFNNVIIKKLAEKYNYTFVDLYTPLMNIETYELYEEYTVDGGHLTAKGYEIVTSVITPVLTDLLS